MDDRPQARAREVDAAGPEEHLGRGPGVAFQPALIDRPGDVVANPRMHAAAYRDEHPPLGRHDAIAVDQIL
ncbi:hypothetical protein D3C73_1372150 [compost metagenome]